MEGSKVSHPAAEVTHADDNHDEDVTQSGKMGPSTRAKGKCRAAN